MLSIIVVLRHYFVWRVGRWGPENVEVCVEKVFYFIFLWSSQQKCFHSFQKIQQRKTIKLVQTHDEALFSPCQD